MNYKLEELVEHITVGQIMSRVSYKDDEEREGYEEAVHVLVPSAISGGVIHHENLGVAVLKKEVSQDRITRNGDIVIKLSSPYDSALITENDEKLVVPSFCALIRGINAERIDVRYLVGYLNSPYTVAKLIAGINSTAMAMIRGKSLMELKIEFPDIYQQRVAGRAYWSSCRKKALLERMVAQQQVVSENIILETLKEVKKNER